MDLLDRYLDFDVWATHRILDGCAGLAADQLHRRFDIGHETLQATLTHIVRVMELWTDILYDRAVRPAPPCDLSVADLRRRFDAAAAEFGARAREVRHRDALDEVMLDTVFHPPAEMTRGTVIADVIAHGITHRAEAVHILARLGVESTGDLAGWEWATERAAPRLGLRGMR